MKKSFNVEVESGELKIVNSNKAQVIIPKDKAQWVKDLIKNKSYSEIDKYVSTLPLMSDYAADGTLFPAVKLKDKNDSRIQKYNDSLYIHNKGEKDARLFEGIVKGRIEDYNKNKLFFQSSLKYKNGVETNSNFLTGKNSLPEDIYKGIEPTYATYATAIKSNGDINEDISMGDIVHYKKPVQPYVVDEFKDEDFKKVLKNKTNNNRIGIDSKLIKTNKTVLYPEKPKQFIKPSYDNFLKTVNPDYLGDDYNLKEAYENAGKDGVHTLKDLTNWASNPEKYHLKDTYKLPNHKTFSTESKYYKPGMKAGKWENDKYIPIEPKKEQVSLIDSSQIKFPGSFSREIMPQEKGYDATKSKTVRYDRKGRIIKN